MMEKYLKWYGKNKSYVFWFTTAAIFVFIYLLNRNTIWAADDYAFYSNVWVGEEGFSLGHVWDVTADFYMRWTGRFVSTFINYIFLYFDKSLFDVANSLVFTGFIYFIYKIVRKDRERSPILILTIFIFIWLFIPQFGQVMLWQIGSVIYLWMMTLLLAILLPFVNLLRKQDKIKDNFISWILLFILAVLAGNGFETNSLMLLFLVTGILIYNQFVRKDKTPTWAWVSYIGLIIGFLSNFFSPGTAIRMSTMGSNDSIITRVLYGLGSFFYRGVVETKLFIIIPIIIVLYFTYILSKQENNRKYLKGKVWFTFMIPMMFSVLLIAMSVLIKQYTLDEFLSWFYVYKNAIMFGGSLFVLLGLLGLTVLMFFVNRKRIYINLDREENAFYLLFFFAAILGTFLYLMTPLAWPRSYMGMVTFFTIPIFYIIYNSSIRKDLHEVKIVVPFLVIVMFSVFAFTYTIAYEDARDAKAWDAETKEYIYEQIELGAEEIIVQTFMSTNEYNAASIEKWVVPIIIEDGKMMTENGIHKWYEWINIAQTKYYFNDSSAWSDGKRIIGYE